MNITDFIIPLITVSVLIYAAIKRVDVFGAFCEGASEGITTCREILPALVLLLVCIGMFRASGAVDIITKALEPLCAAVGFPKEVMPLVILRPFSGSGAMAVYSDIANTVGADTFAERVAATLIGSSETAVRSSRRADRGLYRVDSVRSGCVYAVLRGQGVSGKGALMNSAKFTVLSAQYMVRPAGAD